MKTQWPWITLLLAAAVIFNPVGWAFLTSAIRYSPTDWLRDLSVLISAVGAAVLIVLVLIEWLVRRRMLAKKAAKAGHV